MSHSKLITPIIKKNNFGFDLQRHQSIFEISHALNRSVRGLGGRRLQVDFEGQELEEQFGKMLKMSILKNNGFKVEFAANKDQFWLSWVIINVICNVKVPDLSAWICVS